MRPRLTPYAIAVVVAAILAHAGSLASGFVYDDHRFIERNPAIASLADAPKFFTDASTASAVAGVEPDIYRPIRTLDFAVDRALFGLAPAYWHLASILLHAINALLVWLLIVRLLAGAAPPLAPPSKAGEASRGPLLAATAGAVLFAVHPATVESVAWVSSRGDLLAWTMVLVAFEVLARPGHWRTAIGVALVFLACLAKESAVVAFLLLPLRDGALPAGAKIPWRTTIVRAALLLAATGAYLALRWSVLPGWKQTDFPEGSRAAAGRGMLAGFAWYARVLVWPLGFPFDRNVFTDPVPSSWLDAEVVLGAGLLATLLAAGIVAWRRGSRVVAFACLGSLAALLPVSNVLVPLKAFTAERFLYPVMPCLAAGAAYGLFVLGRRSSSKGAVRLAVGTAAVLIAFGVLAALRGVPWRSETSLWTAARAENPMNPRAYEGLGVELIKSRNLNKAERALETYLEFLPNDGKAVAELADVLRGVSRDLAPGYAGAEAESNIEHQRRLSLGYEIRLRRKAMDIWRRVGLARGRGSPPLVRSNLERWREAAIAYPDLGEAKRVNDLLIFEDVHSPGGAVEPAERGVQVLLAMRSLFLINTSSDREQDPRAREAWEAERAKARAAVLADVGIDPNLPDREAAIALLPLVEPLIAARPDDLGRRSDRVELVTVIVQNLERERQKPFYRIILEDLEVLAARDPNNHAWWEGRLKSVRLILGGR